MDELSREQRITRAFVTVADTLTADYDVIDLLHTLVEICVGSLDVQAGGLALADEHGELRLVASTSEHADFVEMMQLNARSGPCIDVFRSATAVAVADIEQSGGRWPAFRTATLDQGFRSVYVTPMRLRGQVLGAMSLFGTATGVLDPRDAAAVQALADVATIGILQERSIREAEAVAGQLQHALQSRIVIEQAKGMLSAARGIGMDEAFAVLRDHARRNNLTLRSVAEGVAARPVDPFPESGPGSRGRAR